MNDAVDPSVNYTVSYPHVLLCISTTCTTLRTSPTRFASSSHLPVRYITNQEFTLKSGDCCNAAQFQLLDIIAYHSVPIEVMAILNRRRSNEYDSVIHLCSLLATSVI